MPAPLFILGKQRSGTTWLANQLCEHSLIEGPRQAHHGGVHESAYFSHVYGRYGSLEQKTNYSEFVEAMAVSNFMRILEVDKAFLYSLWPTRYEAVFRAVMNRYAERHGAHYWLDKTPEHTLLVHELAAMYPDAKFIAIIRDVHDVVNSTVSRYGGRSMRHRELRLAKATLSWTQHCKAIESFAAGSDRILVTSYELLRNETEDVYRRMCAFLELEFEPTMLKQAYKANSTFRPGRERDKTLSPADRRFIGAIATLGRFIPLPVLNSLGQERGLGVEASRKLPQWFYSMHSPVFEKQTQSSTQPAPRVQGSFRYRAQEQRGRVTPTDEHSGM